MTDAVTLDQLKVFQSAAVHGTFRGAALALNRAPSAVSASVTALEASLGLPLFDRDAYRPVLTRAGEVLLADADAVLRKLDQLKGRAEGLRETGGGRTTLALDPLVSPVIVAAALAALAQAFPLMRVETVGAPLGSGLSYVRRGRCDIALTTAVLDAPDVRLRRLGSVAPLVAVCADGHALATRTAGEEGWSEGALADHRQIAVGDPSGHTGRETFNVESADTWTVESITTKHQLIRAGLGWGYLPQWLVEADLDAGRLRKVVTARTGRSGAHPLNSFLLHGADRVPNAVPALVEGVARQVG